MSTTITKRPRATLFAAALCAATLCVPALGCREGTSPDADGRPSAVLITLDTTRADALGCYAGPPGLTPHLDALARESVLYRRAYAVTPLTLPSHTSMLTGLYPIRHTLRTNGESTLPPSAFTLAEAARKGGVQTAAFVSAVVLDDAFGIDQGFDRYDTPKRTLEKTTTEYADRTYSELVAGVRDWLAQRDKTRPFFLWVHVWDAHGPWNPEPEFARRAPGNPYHGDVAQADHTAGLILEALREAGVYDETFLAVVGDHGEAFREHGEVSHGVYCYESTLRVPLLLRYPDGYRAGETSDEVVSVADIRPTLAAALGLRPDTGLDGRSLYRAGVPADRGVYFESYYGWLIYDWSPVAGWIDAHGKYLHSTQPEFYDIASDPHEGTNLFATRGEDAERYRRAITEIASRPALDGAEAAELDEEQRARIAALGYGSAGPRSAPLPHPLQDTGLRPPRETAEELQLILRATDLLNAGRGGEAEQLHRQILDRNPNNYYSLEFLATLLMQRKDFAAAAPLLQRVMDSERGSASAALNLGICLRATKDEERAVIWLERALEIDANNVRAIRHLFDIWSKKGDMVRARPYAERFRRLTGRSITG